MMRHVLTAAVALVVGIILGGLGPRAEVRRVETKLVELKETECRTLLGSEIARAIGRAQAPAQPIPVAPPADHEGPNPEDPNPADPEPEPDDDPEDFEEGRTILAARRAQARRALIEDADPSPEQLEAFDAAVADMNAEFHAFGEALLARVQEIGGLPPRTELYLYAADGLDVVLETEARIRDALGEQADDVDIEALDPLSHVDPALVDLLIALDQAGFDE